MTEKQAFTGGRPKKLNKTQKDLWPANVRKAVEKHRGILTHAAKDLGCSRQVLAKYLDKHPGIRELATQAREAVIDDLEQVAWRKAIEDEDKTMLIFLLKTMGQSRGYYEGPQWQQGAASQKIEIKLTGAFVAEQKPEIVEHEPLQEIEAAEVDESEG